MDLPKRKNMRLEHYDYAACGAYFVTVCTHDRAKGLSRIYRDDPCGRPCSNSYDFTLDFCEFVT